MNQNRKKLNLIIFIIVIVVFIFSLFSVSFVYAQDNVKFIPQITIPGGVTEGQEMSPNLGVYIKTVYNFTMGMAGILAVVIIMWAGFLWMTARGNAEQVTRAKDYMSGAIIGLVLALGSYTILSIVNPELVELKTISPRGVKDYTICCKNDGTQLNILTSQTCPTDGLWYKCTAGQQCYKGKYKKTTYYSCWNQIDIKKDLAPNP